MGLSDKIEATIESWSDKWKLRLRGWLVDVISIGFDAFFKILGNSFSDKLSPIIESLRKNGNIPPEIAPLLDEIEHPSGEISAMLGGSLGNALIGGVIDRILSPALNPIAYAMNRFSPQTALTAAQAVALWLKGKSPTSNVQYDDNVVNYALSILGYNSALIEQLKGLSKSMLGVEQQLNLWRRGEINADQFRRELEALGFNSVQADQIITLSFILPNAQDIIRFAVKEVYTPEIADKFGQYQDFPDKAMPDALKIGLSSEQMKKYWAAHWELPGAGQGYEMLHRGIISYDELKLLLKALDVMPFWRDKLIQIAYTPYARIDARRMWDMSVLDDAQLKRAYLDEGYNEEHANNLVLWTKAYVTLPDVIARYKNGYISLDDVATQLKALGLSDDKVRQLIERKVKPESDARVATEKALTKAEIIKGLNKGVIDRPTAISLLEDLHYTTDEANFILAINMPESDTQKALASKELTKSDIISGLKNGTITQEDALARLIKLRYTSDDAQYLINLALTTATTVTAPKQKEVTKTEILKGVKQRLITAEDGYLWLQDIGYSADDASFILAINVSATTGSPDTYTEFKQLTQQYRASQGFSNKPVPADLITAEWNVKAAQAALNLAKEHNLPDNEIAPLTKALSDATLKYHTLLTAYKGK